VVRLPGVRAASGAAAVIVNLFSGPGGWCEGLRSATSEVSVGIEHDAAACATRAAAGHLTIRADVSAYPTEPFVGKVTGVIASPPCPDFSSAGKRQGVNGTSGHLIFEVLRWVLALRPKWVACEQVPEVLPWWRLFAERFRQEAGYKTWTGVLCAADYGVPQERYRAFLLAHAERQPQPPTPSHTEHPHDSLFGDRMALWVSMAEGLGWGATARTAPTVTGRHGEATNVFGSVGFGAHKALERERERSLVTKGRGARA
jgi:DNA (cytosine-5)-methyltransferase 1